MPGRPLKGFADMTCIKLPTHGLTGAELTKETRLNSAVGVQELFAVLSPFNEV